MSPPPRKLIRPRPQYLVTIQQFGGVEARMLNWDSNLLRPVVLDYGEIAESEFDTLWNFYVARSGPYESFNLVGQADWPKPLDSGTRIFRFEENNPFEYEQSKQGYYYLTVTLWELFQ
jgi:hypothetical protein